MNKTIQSLLILFILAVSSLLIGQFFGIPLMYYLPFIGWILALVFFYNLLEERLSNKFMDYLEELKYIQGT